MGDIRCVAGDVLRVWCDLVIILFSSASLSYSSPFTVRPHPRPSHFTPSHSITTLLKNPKQALKREREQTSLHKIICANPSLIHEISIQVLD